MEKLSAPSGLHAAHRCSGVHDVGTTSLAPTGRHLTFMFCLETVWRSVLDEANCPDPSLCKASRCIHSNYCLAPTFTKAERCHVLSPPCRSTFPCTSMSMNLCSSITHRFCRSRLDHFTLITVFLFWCSLCATQFNGRLGVRRKKRTHLKWVCSCKSPGLIVVKLGDCSVSKTGHDSLHFMECCPKGNTFPLKIWVTYLLCIAQ